MTVRRSRQEISLSRLLARCQEMANTSDMATDWRLPKFLATCEEMLRALPRAPDPASPSQDCQQEYQNKIEFLRKMVPSPTSPSARTTSEAPHTMPGLPLPQGTAVTRDTVSKQIFQKAAERQNMTVREELFGSSVGGSVVREGGASLDKILAEHRDEQERVAEEMIQLTRSLKEQSAAAGSMVKADSERLTQAADLAETNLSKLGVETARVGEFSARGNCRCWIWLMMAIVILTFVGMVLMMRLFRKKIPVPETLQTDSRSEL